MTRAAAASTDVGTTGPEYFARLALEQLLESPLNPRKTFSESKLDELAGSIREKGIVEPLVVRPDGDTPTGDRFEIICGARRFRAAGRAGVFHVPVIVRTYSDTQALEIMAIENGQRDDVPPLEEAAGYKQLLLIDQTYTAAMIAGRIGHTERFVWDRLRLLELIPDLQAHLAAGHIGVDHAEVLAKLKPAEQKAAASRGLFEEDGGLDFDGAEKPFGKRVVSVRALKQWVARHIRFDVVHAAQAAPLDFGATADRVAAAESQPGRGRKVVPITFEHTCPDGAKAEECTYGSTAWKRAVGKDGQPTCEHAVLGLVVAGHHYGDAFPVCVARDRCTTHWKAEVAAKQKAAKLRDSGKGKQAAKVEKKQAETYEAKNRREAASRTAREKAWEAIESHVVAEAVAQVLAIDVLTSKLADALLDQDFGFDRDAVRTHLGAQWFTRPVPALLISNVATFRYRGWNTEKSGFDQYVQAVAKPFGLDVKRLAAVRDQHAPVVEAAPATATKPATKKAAKRR